MTNIPYTISYVIRKRLQLDSLNEIEEKKRPPDKIIWDGTVEELNEWIEEVVYKHEPHTIDISENEIEG